MQGTVLKSPRYKHLQAGTDRYQETELCDTLIITNSHVIMLEVKTRCDTPVTESWMRSKPVEMRWQSFKAKELMKASNSTGVDFDSSKLANKKWVHVAVLNSDIPGDDLHYVKFAKNNGQYDGGFDDQKVLTLEELEREAKGLKSWDSIKNISTMMEP